MERRLIKGLIVFAALGLAFGLNVAADWKREKQSRLQASFFAQININQASPKELELLPHVGKAMAERIVRDRTRNGFYRTPQDLLRVRGLGPKRLNQIAPYLVTPTPDGGGE